MSVTQFFLDEGVDTEADLAGWLDVPDHVKRLKQLSGIGNKTADYFRILAGTPAVAVDSRLFKFLAVAGIDTHDYAEA